MAKNYASTGETVSVTATAAAGIAAGVPLVINDLVVMPLQTVPKGGVATCRTVGAWDLPAAAGLKQGQKVSVLDGSLVAPATANAVPFGKLLSDAASGYATALLIQ